MKTKILVALVVLAFTAGCGGQRQGILKIDNKNGTITHNDWNASLLQGSIGPNQLANAEATIITASAQADLTRALAKQIEQGHTATITGKYIGMIVNDDPRLTAYIPHPEMNQRVNIAPGSWAFLATNNIADRITIYDAWGDYTVVTTDKKGGTYNGITYDYGVRIYKVR